MPGRLAVRRARQRPPFFFAEAAPVSVQTVLVVEDDPLQREGLRYVLEQAGYAVAVVAGPGEALTEFQTAPPPDLILLDMLHPKSRAGDGWHFMRRRQQLPDLRAVPVVIVTALGNASPEWAVSLGADGLLRKPVDPGQVVAEVRRRLEGKRQPAGSPGSAVPPTAPAEVTKRTDPNRADGKVAGLARALIGRLLRGHP
jgi:CheY-like chemotaxis protein